MEKEYPDICVWFEFNLSFFPSETERPYPLEILENEDDENEESTLEQEINRFIFDNKYYVLVHGCVDDYGSYSFNIFNCGWHNLPFRVFLEVDPNIKINFLNMDGPGPFYKVRVTDSEEKDGSSAKSTQTHLINLLIPDDICIIEGVSYKYDHITIGTCTTLFLSPTSLHL